jgi:hypothetical protein
MTITDDYKVFAGRYHPSSGAFSRPPLEVTDLRADAQEILHGLGVPQLPTKKTKTKTKTKPHGLARGGPLGGAQGTFWMKIDETVISSVGGSRARKAEQVGKSLSDLGCDALEVGISPRGRHTCFICQCDLV